MIAADYQGVPLLRRLVDFCQALKEADVAVTTSETLDAAIALGFVDLSEKNSLYRGLKTALAKKPEYYSRFDLLFEQYWIRGKAPNPLGRMIVTSRPGSHANYVKSSPEAKGKPDTTTKQSRSGPAVPDETVVQGKDEDRRQLFALYSPIETASRKTFSGLGIDDRAVLKRGLRTFARRMATRPGRRLTSAIDGRLDFNMMLRASLKSGGHITEIMHSAKKISKPRLVFLCDISGSMDVYSNRLLTLLYYACNTIHGTQVFGFSTQLVALNKYMQGKSLWEAADLVSENVDIWSSGTKIGTALGDFLERYSGILRPSTVFVMVSDGWEIGDLDVLKNRMREIREKVSRLVWLNPQADSPNYSPQAAGMRTAMPFIDVFCGLNIFTDRREFERVLGRVIHQPLGNGKMFLSSLYNT